MNKLYIHTEDIHNLDAPRDIVPLIMDLVKPKSVLDVGCGTGTWLKVFEEHGVENYLGVDGDYVERNHLKIPLSKFMTHDLRHELNVHKKFDLVVSLEVAEHLPETCADDFVNSLVRHGDVIMFSAAIPGQGGQNHLNEQWPEYWSRKFSRHGFYFHDTIRPIIWNSSNINWWYKQNTFLVTKEPSLCKMLNIVHPHCFDFQVSTLKNSYEGVLAGNLGVLTSSKILFRSFRNLLWK